MLGRERSESKRERERAIGGIRLKRGGVLEYIRLKRCLARLGSIFICFFLNQHM